MFGERFVDITRMQVIKIVRPGTGAIGRPRVSGTRLTIDEALFVVGDNGRVSQCTSRIAFWGDPCESLPPMRAKYSEHGSLVFATDVIADLPVEALSNKR